MTPSKPLPFGLWELVSQRPFDGPPSDMQLSAARYLIGDMPPNASLGYGAAGELLSVRSYVIGLLASLYGRGGKAHPREAMLWVLREAYQNPPILKGILRWSRNRYFEDRGPTRVSATRYFSELHRVVVENCHTPTPSEIQSIAVRDAELKAFGIGRIINSKSATIHYRNEDEITVRTISDIQLSSSFPWWSYWLIGAPAFMSISGFCHLRNENRTFAARKIQHVR
ncbi:hypothetical protein WSK_3134 [Novosphingobium sp. Rr 2-17]|nr:hypothetical protein WSK_3134 [Novosphingobium sp. Rr 2-17]